MPCPPAPAPQPAPAPKQEPKQQQPQQQPQEQQPQQPQDQQPEQPGQQQAPEAGANAAGTEAFAQAPSGGTPSGGSFNPSMFGDLVPLFANTGASQNAVLTRQGTTAATLARLKNSKIANNNFAGPLDQVTIEYSRSNGLGTIDPGARRVDLQSEVYGVEKTLGGHQDASIGLRLPVNQFTPDGFGQNGVGDLTVFGKYAWVNDRCADGSMILTTGLAVTVPTGHNPFTNVADSVTHDTLVQPFVSFYSGTCSCFLEGFSAAVIPTDSRDVTVLFNDIGAGYWLYRHCDNVDLLTGIAPTIEAHFITPLDHRGGAGSPSTLSVPDVVTVTGGAHFYFRCVEVGAAAGIPVTGPRPDQFEVVATLNVRF
jgi:hypothetical protein